MDFGYNICQFNPYIRWMLERFPYDEVKVICREDEKYIWEDVATEFHFLHYKTNMTNRWLFKGKKLQIPYKTRKKLGTRDKRKGNRVVIPNEKNCNYKKRRTFIPFGEEDYELDYDIVFHARATAKNGSVGRNWPIENYGEFIDRLGKEYRMCSIGIDAHHIPGTDDMREIPLDQLCNLIRSSKLVMGPACGFMALANLCQTPSLMWTDNKIDEKFGTTHRMRLKHAWRPFREIPQRMVERYGWNPTPLQMVKEFMKCRSRYK